MNPDKFIEELLSKKYDKGYISDMLKIQELNNSILNISQNNSRQRHVVNSYLDSREASYQNLLNTSDTKRRTQCTCSETTASSIQKCGGCVGACTNLRFSYLKARSTQPHKGLSFKTEHRPGFSYNTSYKNAGAIKASDEDNEGDKFQEILRPYFIKKTPVETTNRKDY